MHGFRRNERKDLNIQQPQQEEQSVPYVLPHNLQEINRLDFQHYLSRQLLGGNYLVPIRQPRAILDVGCGTGRWMLELAKEFPKADITGIDLNTPSLALPPNCHFVKGNILERVLPFPNASVDFVHQRLLVLAIPTARWPYVLRELIRVTRPGGWIELVEGDLFMQNRGPITDRITAAFFQTCQKRGIDLQLSQRLPNLLDQAGLGSITHRQEKIAFGSWGGRVGQVALKDQLAAIQSVRAALAPQLGISVEDYDRLIDVVAKECEEKKSFSHLHVFYAQKL